VKAQGGYNFGLIQKLILMLAQDLFFKIIKFFNQIHFSLPIGNMFLIGQPRIIFLFIKVSETHTMQHNFDETF
jgi:hypothetical protein